MKPKLVFLSTNPGFATSEPLASLTQTRTVPVVEMKPLKVVSAGRLNVIWYVVCDTVKVSVVLAWAVSMNKAAAVSKINADSVKSLLLPMWFTYRFSSMID